MSEDLKLTVACNAWHIDSLERLSARLSEVLPLVKRFGPVYTCQPELARRISVSALRLQRDVAAFLKAAEEHSRNQRQSEAAK